MLLSVCIPTYNRPSLALRALNSVLNQSYKDVEILIHDNSEDDATEKLLSTVRDPRVHYYRHPQNIGIAGNWNSLLESARGEYVKFLNDDDELLPDCLEQVVRAIQWAYQHMGEVGVLTLKAEYKIGHKKKVDPPGPGGERDYYIEGGLVPAIWLSNKRILRTPTHSCYHRKSALAVGGFSPNLPYARDVFLGLQLAYQKGVLVMDSRPLVRFYVHTGQDGKRIPIKDRIKDLLFVENWALQHCKHIPQTEMSHTIAAIYLREALLMLKTLRVQEFIYAFSRFVQNPRKKLAFQTILLEVLSQGPRRQYNFTYLATDASNG